MGLPLGGRGHKHTHLAAAVLNETDWSCVDDKGSVLIRIYLIDKVDWRQSFEVHLEKRTWKC